MSTIQHRLRHGDLVAYYLVRKVSDRRRPTVPIRKVGRVQAARDDQVKVLHAGGYTEWVHGADLYLIDAEEVANGTC